MVDAASDEGRADVFADAAESVTDTTNQVLDYIDGFLGSEATVQVRNIIERRLGEVRDWRRSRSGRVTDWREKLGRIANGQDDEHDR